MLDASTKRRIDTARDILVGKVPDPKSQVEQITIALIYKFMDDMDAESEEFGGKRTFFAGGFAKYGWARLMRAGLGGHDMLALYADAVAKMPENPGIPPLFRDIFKNAYLPYRDPETLRAFLKIIDTFTYDHSERLGDAFEYLLSVLGSQGDAGQFRTPRHIIDFMVEVTDPKKNETVLDPACGTAGFLISAYKHILKAGRMNMDEQDKKKKDKSCASMLNPLTPEEKGRLARNFKGYDISPDMVRLSLVNLYLHGFTDPHIHEYDTLTSQERWNEYADVILANPPFMSPKGGIKPHNRFSVQSKRSEVLFVDYMAEHLMPNGRAAIIVPEGIIFQSQTAYKQLRKMLVEKYLVAVVSLPAGVFQPYSGVKTSILFLDKQRAKKAGGIAFFRVENDGFGLGAQRREIDKNDLPDVAAALKEYLNMDAQDAQDKNPPSCPSMLNSLLESGAAIIVPKEKLAQNGDYNLSGERYRANGVRASSYPLVAIQDVAEVASGFGFPLDQQGKTDQDIPFLKVSDMNLPGNEIRITSWNNTVSRETLRELRAKSFPKGTVIFPKIGAAIATNKKRILACESTYDNNVMGIVPSEQIVSEFLYALLQSFDLSRWASDSQPPSMRKTVVEAQTFPLPPLEVQKEIVAEIEGYQKVIDGARAVLDNYRPHIPIHPDWPMVELGEVCENIQYGLSVPLNTEGLGYKTFRMNELVDGRCIDQGDMKCATISANEFTKYRLNRGDILFNRTNSFEHVGRTGIFDLKGEYCFASYLIRLVIKAKIAEPSFVNVFMNSKNFQQGIKQFASRAIGQSNINAKNLAAYPIPLPPLATQQAIVAEIEAEQALVAANRELIARMEKKIQATLARVWGEEENQEK